MPWTCCTFLSWSCTAELSPSGWPHVTILLSPQHHSAKAPRDIFLVPATVARGATAVRQSWSSSCASTSDWEGSPKMCPSAVTSLRRSQESLLKRHLGQNLQVPYFGGPRNWNAFSDCLPKLQTLETSIESTEVAQHDNAGCKRNLEPKRLRKLLDQGYTPTKMWCPPFCMGIEHQ